MKATILISIFTFFTNQISAQAVFPQPNWAGNALDFEDTSVTQYFYVDTLIANNIWAMGQPNKTIFDSSFSDYNALVTDTAFVYPINNYSLSQMKILGLSGILIFNFYHRFDTEPGKDGGKIELSFDNGLTWVPITDDAFFTGYNMYINRLGYYTNSDTITGLGNSPGFSGNSNGWTQSWFELIYQNATITIDTLELRFVFGSDSVFDNKDGWMVDDVYVNYNHIGFEELTYSQIKLRPNPSQGLFNIATNNPPDEFESLIMYNSMGEIVYRQIPFYSTNVDVRNLENGIYFLSCRTINRLYSNKIVIMH